METFEIGPNAFYIMIGLQAYGIQGVECSGLNENDCLGSHIRILSHLGVEMFKKGWKDKKGFALLE